MLDDDQTSYSYSGSVDDTNDQSDYPRSQLRLGSILPAAVSQQMMMSSMRRENAALIAVMGSTGSGKTTFINKACDAGMEVGNNLESCTQTVQVSHAFKLGNRTVHLIDTPGFDDTNRSNAEILKEIALYLSESYRSDIRICGVIYFHRITDNRVSGTSKRNMKMFQELCGFNAMSNVIIVTNMWGNFADEKARREGEAREAQLGGMSIFLKQALDGGAKIFRHDNSTETARNIISTLLRNEPVTLLIQKEMVDEKKSLTESAAGSQLNHELREQIKKHEEEMREVLSEIAAKHKDERYEKELEEEARKLKELLNKVHMEKEKMATDFEKMKKEYKDRGGC
ncbi:P-loop containing nucleoside triphosphate hydrolase protein [Rhodocollybia butyracea]|uniref:P-loop containing nucleoside triphosphate hydrolase protein n=1 Tax=Rhodocollybia butyracea TaxID=206335 RepID=A0A9P5UDP8_9AGAR|nr:P-loop containing nucleoside triphosphate hydrolase protein [Rhodocollybia butyracea]